MAVGREGLDHMPGEIADVVMLFVEDRMKRAAGPVKRDGFGAHEGRIVEYDRHFTRLIEKKTGRNISHFFKPLSLAASALLQSTGEAYLRGLKEGLELPKILGN